MSANPRFLFPHGPVARSGARHQASRQMLETAGRYFELTPESIRRVLDNEMSGAVAMPAPTAAAPAGATRRTAQIVDVHSRMLAAIRRSADGGCGKEE